MSLVGHHIFCQWCYEVITYSDAIRLCHSDLNRSSSRRRLSSLNNHRGVNRTTILLFIFLGFKSKKIARKKQAKVDVSEIFRAKSGKNYRVKPYTSKIRLLWFHNILLQSIIAKRGSACPVYECPKMFLFRCLCWISIKIGFKSTECVIRLLKGSSILPEEAVAWIKRFCLQKSRQSKLGSASDKNKLLSLYLQHPTAVPSIFKIDRSSWLSYQRWFIYFLKFFNFQMSEFAKNVLRVPNPGISISSRFCSC